MKVMGFKTAEDGHVYNDDKKNSGSHHGSVRPQTGVRAKMSCSVCGAKSHDTKNHEAYAKAWDEKFFPKGNLNPTWVEFYGTDEDRKELARQKKELIDLREKWRTTFGYRPNEFKNLSSGELGNEISAYERHIAALKYGVHDGAIKHKKEIDETEKKIMNIRNELGIRRVENNMLEDKIRELDKASEKELMNIRNYTRDQISYDAVVWVLRKRGLWKGSTEKTEEFLKNR